MNTYEMIIATNSVKDGNYTLTGVTQPVLVIAETMKQAILNFSLANADSLVNDGNINTEARARKVTYKNIDGCDG